MMLRVTKAELCKAITDAAHDAAELTRIAMICARERSDDFAELVADDSAVALAWVRRELVDALCETPLPIELSPKVRAQMVEILERSLEPRSDSSEDRGVLAVAAHYLALSLEEAFGSRFFDHLAAEGERDLTTEDLLPRSTSLNDPRSPLRRHYGKKLGTDPARLHQPQPGELERYGRLAPKAPYRARLRWAPTWRILDELEPSSIIAALYPVNFGDLEVPNAEGSGEHARFFGVRPKDPDAAGAAAIDLIAKADAQGAAVVVFPELCLDRAAIDRVADWVEVKAENVLVAVCGSCHEETEHGGRSNNAVIACADPGVGRVVQTKLRPFRHNGALEDIRHTAPVIRLLCSREWSLVTSICIDFFDSQLADFIVQAGPSLALVPACSESTGPLSEAAAHLASRTQAHVVVANQNVPPSTGHPHADGAIRARPVRTYNDVITSFSSALLHAPAMRLTRLCSGVWQKKLEENLNLSE